MKHLDDGVEQRGEVVDGDAPKGSHDKDYANIGRNITDSMFSSVLTVTPISSRPIYLPSAPS